MKIITRLRSVRTIVVLSAIIMISSLSAHALCEGFYVQFPGLRHLHETENSQQVPGQDDSNNSIPDDSVFGSAADSPVEPEQPSEEDPETEPFLLEPKRHYTLDDKETNDLFFLSGFYTITDWLSPAMIEEDEPPAESVPYHKITDWNSPGEIAETIKPFIEDLCSQQVPNLFDEIAPESTCRDISKASDLQEKMNNSADLDNIITVRSDVWPEYPKFSIANLLANNMQRYAQEYLKIDGSYETVKYYQAQSIFWSFKSLVFASVNPSMRKTILNYISMRYHDIADMAVAGSTDQIYATAFSEAFQILENSEFSFSSVSDPEQTIELITPEDAPLLPQG